VSNGSENFDVFKKIDEEKSISDSASQIENTDKAN